jgi:hypothetical protein
MRRKRILFCGVLLSLLLMGAGEKPQDSNQSQGSDDRFLWLFGAALVGILTNGLSQLLRSGANQQILDQVAKSLTPIQDSLSELNKKNHEFDKTLQTFNITLISIHNRQDADKTLLKQEITNLGDRLENRIFVLEQHNSGQDRKLNRLNEDVTNLKIRKASNE